MSDVISKEEKHSEIVHLAQLAVESVAVIKGVKGASPLLLLPHFDVVNSVVPEYMHGVLLGVTRQFINIWTDSSNSKREFYLKNIELVDKLLVDIKPPDDIKCLPRGLSEKKFWKATEFRHFLLIYSPVILRQFLPRRYYAHWLLLVSAISLLLKNAITQEMIAVSRSCLHKFIVLVPVLYGTEHVSYNVHCLSHLPNTVINWGPLWAHSAFIYEDAIRFLKKLYHGTQPVPLQVFKLFCVWRALQHRSPRLYNAPDTVKKLSAVYPVSSACYKCFQKWVICWFTQVLFKTIGRN
jgi:hypothetical protein